MTSKEILDLYNNPKTGLKGINAFARENGLKPSDVKEALESSDAYTLNKPVIRNFPTRKIFVPGPHDQFQVDLADVSNVAKENDGVHFLLVAIDCFTRKAFVFALANKKASTVYDALKDLVENEKMNFLQTDDGSEFTNAKVQKLLKDHDIEWFSTRGSNTKAAMAERFIRTLRGRLGRLADSTGSERYISDLEKIVENYNNTKHSSTGIAPNKFIDEDKDKVFQKLYAKHFAEDIPAPKYKIGDIVRISSARSPFAKEGTSQRWTRELFTVSEVIRSNPPTYHLTDYRKDPIEGIFYEPEMTKAKEPETYLIEKILDVKGRGKNRKFLVKWLGYSNDFNTWEPEDALPSELVEDFLKSVKDK